MDTGAVIRQHESTEVYEVRDRECAEFVAVQNDRSKALGLLYIKLDGVWHRFYLDAGVLFWEEGSGPEPEDDLLEHDSYIDLAETLRVRGNAMARVDMHDCRLSIQFENGAILELYEGVQQGEGSSVVKMLPAGS